MFGSLKFTFRLQLSIWLTSDLFFHTSILSFFNVLSYTFKLKPLFEYITVFSDTNPLNKYSEDLYPLLVSVINDRSPQLRGLGITGVVGLLALEDFLTETQTTNISQFLLHVVTQDEDQDVRYNYSSQNGSRSNWAKIQLKLS